SRRSGRQGSIDAGSSALTGVSIRSRPTASTVNEARGTVAAVAAGAGGASAGAGRGGAGARQGGRAGAALMKRSPGSRDPRDRGQDMTCSWPCRSLKERSEWCHEPILRGSGALDRFSPTGQGPGAARVRSLSGREGGGRGVGSNVQRSEILGQA